MIGRAVCFHQPFKCVCVWGGGLKHVCGGGVKLCVCV